MSAVYPFRGFRPQPELAAQVASPPYDVLDSDEARAMAAGNPYTFLHAVKPEIDLPPEMSLYDDRVYAQGVANLRKFIDDGVLVQDGQPCLYAYAQRMGEHRQVGLMACASVAEYEQGHIKKHEFTRPDKENDRTRHILESRAQNGPVFLAYRSSGDTRAAMAAATAGEPTVDFTADDGIQHTLWVIDDAALIQRIEAAFGALPDLYIADGHHRSASALRVRDALRDDNPDHTGEEPYNRFLSVVFPAEQLQILAYNRVVKDLNGMAPAAFVERISREFEVAPMDDPEPDRAGCFGCYLDGSWHRLRAKEGTYDAGDAVARLDAAILQSNLLAPVLGIGDPRTDARIKFVGGIRGTQELEALVNSGKFTVAFSLFPTSIDQLFSVADDDQVMPPKSTWFEPKLRSGMVIHLLR